MKKLFIASVMSFAAFAASAENVTIKGIRLDMPEKEFMSQNPKGSDSSWTIGGVKSKYVYTGGSPTFEEGKLVAFTFFFRSDDYSDVKDAVANKYPKIKCRSSTIQNRMGATFAQEVCTYGELTIQRYFDDIETGLLSLYSPKYLKKLENESKAKRGDI